MKKKHLLAITAALILAATAWASYTYRQCAATTKAGTRCTRGVSNAADAYCYQHK